MPSARSIAGNIAKLLGRPESEGWVFTRLFQDRGLFLKGHGGRGGTGAFPAHTPDAVLLLLAMATASGAAAAVKDVGTLYTLQLNEGRHYRLAPMGEDWDRV